MLHDDRPGSDPLAVTDISNLQLEQVASPQLAVDAKIEQRQLARLNRAGFVGGSEP